MIDRTQIDATLSTASLVQLAEQAGASLHKEGREWRGNCPLHGGDNSSAFAIFISQDGTERWHCFSNDCGGGDAINFVEKWKGINFLDAYKYLTGGLQIDPQDAARFAAQRAERAAIELEAHIERASAVLADLRLSQMHLVYHQAMDDDGKRDLWNKRGVHDDFIDYLKLGYCSSFQVETKQGRLTTPTLSIPIFGVGFELLNIRHRLLANTDPKDKYRPERAGLGSAPPLLFDPDIGMDTDRILWCEGEIKAIVTGQTLDTPGFQVVGLPGKSNWKTHVQGAIGKDNWIVFDPGAEKEAAEFGKAIHGRIIVLPEKIDDMILKCNIERGTIVAWLKHARLA